MNCKLKSSTQANVYSRNTRKTIKYSKEPANQGRDLSFDNEK